jgi:hypothetical protein
MAGCCEHGYEPTVFIRSVSSIIAGRLLASEEGLFFRRMQGISLLAKKLLGFQVALFSMELVMYL